jgi:hypothetical protein
MSKRRKKNKRGGAGSTAAAPHPAAEGAGSPGPRGYPAVTPWEAAILGLTLLFALMYNLHVNLVFDDAYIFLRYVRNIANGDGYTFNPGDAPPVDGITSPLWLAILSMAWPCRAWFLSIDWMLVSLSFGFGLLWLWLFHRTIRSLLPDWMKPAAALAPILYMLQFKTWGAAAGTGMETTLAACLALAYATAFHRMAERELGAPSAWICGGLGFLGAMTRPEFALLALGAPTLRAIAAWAGGAKGGRWRLAADCLRCLLGTTLPLGAWAALKLHYFGELLPLPFHVKGFKWAIPYDGFDALATAYYAGEFASFLHFHAPLLLAAAMGLFIGRAGRRLAWLWAPTAGIVVYQACAFPVMGGGFRYYFPWMGVVAILPFLALRERLAAAAPFELSPRRARLLSWSIILAYAMLVAVSTAHRLQFLPFGHPEMARNASLEPEMSAIAATAPAGCAIAATEVGLLGFICERQRIIDLSGLNDLAFSRGFDADALFKRRPDVLFLVHEDYRGMTKAIRAHPEFKKFAPALGRGWGTLHTTAWLRTGSAADQRLRAWLRGQPDEGAASTAAEESPSK